MKLDRIWNGRFPKYWDITTWTILMNNHVVSCYRHPVSNRRMFDILNLLDKSKVVTETIYNVIIGYVDNVVYFALVADARSHIQISRLAAYNIQTSSYDWKTNEIFLIEKYRIPNINEYSKEHYNLGNKQVNLNTGSVTEYNLLKNFNWPINNDLHLVQNGDSLECIDNFHNVIWSREKYYGSLYQGVEGNELVFMLANETVVLLDKMTGIIRDMIELPDLRILNNRITGSLYGRNDRSSDNSSIADVLMSEEILVWINSQGNIMVKERETGNINKYEIKAHELYLSMIQKKRILMFDLQDEDYGDLVVFEIGG